MKNVFFKPWIGENYEIQEKKLLILGEAHYGVEDLPQNYTRDLTQGYIDGEIPHRFWTQIMQVVSDKPKHEIDKSEFWNKYVFYNYIQQPVAPSAGVAPNSEMSKNALLPLSEVIDELKPTHILVISKRLWMYFSTAQNSGNLIIETISENFKYFKTSQAKAIANFIHHPSRISYQDWSNQVKNLLNRQ